MLAGLLGCCLSVLLTEPAKRGGRQEDSGISFFFFPSSVHIQTEAHLRSYTLTIHIILACLLCFLPMADHHHLHDHSHGAAAQHAEEPEEDFHAKEAAHHESVVHVLRTCRKVGVEIFPRAWPWTLLPPNQGRARC